MKINNQTNRMTCSDEHINYDEVVYNFEEDIFICNVCEKSINKNTIGKLQDRYDNQ